MPRPTKNPKELTSTQMEALDFYHRANSDIEALIKRIGAQKLLSNAMRHASKWYYQRGSSVIDCHLKLWVTKENRKLFTTNSINRLLSLLHRNYQDVVLVKFVIIGSDGRFSEEKCEV